MRFTSLLTSTVANICTVSAAYSVDTIIAPETEPVQYVSVCNAYGAGFFYIPGTETCLGIHGYVLTSATGGSDVYGRGFEDRGGVLYANRKNRLDTWDMVTRFALRFSTASETELGTLKTYADTRLLWTNGKNPKSSGSLRAVYIQLGGLRVGLVNSAFLTFNGYLGDVFNDDVIAEGGGRTNLISYTFTGNNGVSAILSLENGNNISTDEQYGYKGMIDGYMPHVVGGLKYAQGWGSLVVVAAYDTRNKDWAGKIRSDFTITDRLSLWVMGGYKSNKDQYMNVVNENKQIVGQVRAISSMYGQWGGDWAFWGGGKYKATDQTEFNGQLAYDSTNTFAATANITYELAQDFTVMPEVSYTQWNDKKSVLDGQHAWQGMIVFLRSF